MQQPTLCLRSALPCPSLTPGRRSWRPLLLLQVSTAQGLRNPHRVRNLAPILTERIAVVRQVPFFPDDDCATLWQRPPLFHSFKLRHHCWSVGEIKLRNFTVSRHWMTENVVLINLRPAEATEPFFSPSPNVRVARFGFRHPLRSTTVGSI
jgi:hypothetical protein